VADYVEPLYRMHGAPEPIDEEGSWLCVTFQRLGADASPDNIIRVRMSREDYQAAAEGRPIPGRESASANWWEHEILELGPCA
jgi:hypothetical protein